jgi:hypothetical protein
MSLQGLEQQRNLHTSAQRTSACTILAPRRRLAASIRPLLVPGIVGTPAELNATGLRAVLSWNTPPSTTNPNELKTWGNRLDVHVQIRPGEGHGTELTDLIYRVGGVALSDISTSSHLAFPSTFLTGLCGAAAMDRPWGGLVTIQGRIYNTGVPISVRFRVRYKKHADLDVDTNWNLSRSRRTSS